MPNGKINTMMLSGRKIDRGDYNIFREGLNIAYNATRGIFNEHIGNALRHYGQHLKDNDLDHIKDIDKKSRSRRNTISTTMTTIIGPNAGNDPVE